jgi:hypothetical protein
MTLAIWEQARAAISATQVTGGMRAIFTRRVIWDQLLDNAGFRTVKQSTAIETGTDAQPWRSASPEILHARGYIEQFDDSTAYRAPGLEMLASPLFFEDHCFRLANAREHSEINVEFDATPERRMMPEIRGSFTLDRATAQLKRLEFRYVNRENVDLESGARGMVEFERLRNGAWVISRWNIRMPILELNRTMRRGGESLVRVANVRSMGGEMALVAALGDTLFSRPPLVLTGSVQDSVTGRDLAGVRVTLQGTGLAATSDSRGRFALSGVLPGEYDLAVHTPGLDSLGTVSETMISITDAKEPVRVRVAASPLIVRSICGARERPGIPGIVVGMVTGPDRGPLPKDTKVSLEWTDPSSGTVRTSAVPLDTNGNFRVCGVPVATSVTLRAAADSVRATPVIFVLAAEKPIETFLVDLSTRAVGTATLAGTVVVDSGGAPIEGVEIILPSIALNARSDPRGAYRLTDIPAGTHRVLARRPGYSPLDATLTFAANETVTRRLVLSRVTVLNEVVVTADRGMRSFEEHKALGLGKFLTREYIETVETNDLSAIVRTFPGVWMYAPPDPKGRISYLTSNRRCLPDMRMDVLALCIPCYSLVIVDGMPMNRHGQRGISLHEISLKDVEAIEHYPSAALVPAKYRSFETQCGLLVIHTLRSFRSSTRP